MQDHLTSLISRELIATGYTYLEYRQLIDQLLAQDKTTGPNHSESYLEYTKLNVHRMNRWDKMAKISPELAKIVTSIASPQVWLVITEGWCGDAAQSLPFVAKLAAVNPLIELKFVLRDQNPALMDAYLTEGAGSIPVLIGLSGNLSDELFVWGPRPQFLQNRLKAYKLDPQHITPKEFADGTHLWYARDKNQSLQVELLPLIASTL